MKYLENDKNISLKEFFEKAKKHENDLVASGKYTDEQIQVYKQNFLALQYTTQNYIKQQELYPELYQDISDALLKDLKEIYPDLLAIYEYMQKCEDGDILMEKINLLTTVALLNISRQTAIEAGIADNMNIRVVQATTAAIENIFEIAVNDKTGEFEDKETGLIESEKILKRYPRIIKVMKDEVTQSIFKNKVKKQEPYSYSFQEKNRKLQGVVVLSNNGNVDGTENIDIEKSLSYYDWAVMEAVVSLYLYAVETRKDVNGHVLLDIKSIDKILKHNTSSKMVETKVEEQQKTELYKSLRRLCSNYVQISEEDKEYDGNLLDGEFVFKEGKLCIRIKSKPILYEYADTNGRNHILETALDNLYMKGMVYTVEKIAIYRYLLQRVLEIYGTLKIGDTINGKIDYRYGTTNSIPLDNIIDALYPEGIQASYADAESKKRWIKKSVEDVLDIMSQNKFFNSYEIKYDENGKCKYSLRRK